MIDWQAIGRRIRTLRKSLDMTQSELGKKLGALGKEFEVSGASVSNWEKGLNLSLNRVFQIAQVLGKPPSILLSDGGNKEHNENFREPVEAKSLEGRHMPRYTFEMLSEPGIQDEFVDKIQAHFPCSENSFALLINDRANADTFLPGDSVVIDPDLRPKAEDMVFAYVGEKREPVFRQYEENEAGGYTLRALNEKHRSYLIGASDRCQIIGVMTEHTRPRRI